MIGTTPDITLRPMRRDDLPAGMRLKEAAGWNQTPADWRRLLELSRGGCFVATLPTLGPVGTVATVRFGDVAWVAMVLVDPAARRRGVGRSLMAQALQHLDAAGVRTVMLDATASGRPLYEGLGFAAGRTFTRFRGVLGPSAEPCPPQVIVGNTSHLAATAALDRKATGADRSDLLARLCNEQPGNWRIWCTDRRPTGYGTWRPGSHAAQIGPVVARADARADRLLDAVAEPLTGEAAMIDLPADRADLLAWARRRGLVEERRFTRMHRGTPPTASDAMLIASSGPEKG